MTAICIWQQSLDLIVEFCFTMYRVYTKKFARKFLDFFLDLSFSHHNFCNRSGTSRGVLAHAPLENCKIQAPQIGLKLISLTSAIFFISP